MAPLKTVGLMTGTSFDGVDAALLETDGITLGHTGPSLHRPYSGPERGLRWQVLAEAAARCDRRARAPRILAEAERLVTNAHAETVEGLFREHRIDCTELAIIGFLGQTVLHRPVSRLAVQIGDGPGLAWRLGIPVAYDFRAAGMAAGGRRPASVIIPPGAGRSTRLAAVAVLNIGGVANVAYVDPNDDLVAFDTGPGNALLDDFMLARTGEPRDEDGAAAKSGTPDHRADSEPSGRRGELAIKRLWRCSGRGLPPDGVVPASALGRSGDSTEAQAFTYLAVRTLQGAPITFPGTTGVAPPMPGGVVAQPQTGHAMGRA